MHSIGNNIAARIAESFARQTMMTTLGGQILSVEPGLVRLAAPICRAAGNSRAMAMPR